MSSSVPRRCRPWGGSVSQPSGDWPSARRTVLRVEQPGGAQSFRANGIDIFYERAGVGPRLVFLNGSGATIESSRVLVAPFLQKFEVVTHDQRGLGRTGIPDNPATMEDYAADVGALMDHAGWDSASIVGLSFGGMVAQEFAVTYPQRVDSLVLMCTSPGGAQPSYPLHELEAVEPAERSVRYRRLLDERFDDEWLSDHRLDSMLVSVMEERGRAEKSAEQRRGERLQLDARWGHDVLDRLDRVTARTLVASGRYDGIAPPVNGRSIADRIPGAIFRLFEGGHMFMVQDPTASSAIIEFLLDD